MNTGENGDSLWLQKSIHLTDPIPDTAEQTSVTTEGGSALRNTEEKARPLNSERSEMELELTKMPLSFNSTRILQRSSQRLSCRLSMPNPAFASLHELDDLRARVSQMTRERLKWSNSQRDLEIARFELTQAREELKTMREYIKVIKGELDAANARADREVHGRQTLEKQLNDVISQRESEICFLRQQIDVLKEEQGQHIAEMAEKSEMERSSRADTVREQVVQMTEVLESLEVQLAEVEEVRVRLLAENEEMRVVMSSLQERQLEAQRSAEGYASRCTDLEKMHAEFVTRIETTHEETLKSHIALSEEQVRQLTNAKDDIIKDLQNELATHKEKFRSVSEELSSLRYRFNQQEEDARQAQVNHDKEIKRVRDEHRLAICQLQLQTEMLVREAKGGRISIEEEKSSLKRQLQKLSEELSTVTTILAQREKQVAQVEKELVVSREALLNFEQKHIITSKEAEEARDALNHAEERVERLMEQQDKSDVDYSKDLSELKHQLTLAKEELVRVRSELSVTTQDRIRADTESRSIIAELRSILERTECERNTLQSVCREKKQAEELAQEYRAKYLAVCKKSENLDIELVAVTNRCALLEKRLDEELRRSLRNASVSPTPERHVITTAAPSSTNINSSHIAHCASTAVTATTVTAFVSSTEATTTTTCSSAIAAAAAATSGATTTAPASVLPTAGTPTPLSRRRLRSTSSVNIALSLPNNTMGKKSRSVEPRVFTISGFEGSELLTAIKQLPYAAVAECRSNAPVPSNLTHLVTNGQLTIKLLTALVRGCWILPEEYVHDSLKQDRWLDESAYGFRHEDLPLARKRIFFTGGFTSSRHYNTSSLITSEGGAVVESDPDVADILLCTHNEFDDFDGTRAMTWDKMVDLIYPIKIGLNSESH